MGRSPQSLSWPGSSSTPLSGLTLFIHILESLSEGLRDKIPLLTFDDYFNGLSRKGIIEVLQV